MVRSKKIIDLFAGAGGFSLGFKLANYDVSISLEIDEWATDTLTFNCLGDTVVLQDDIRLFNYKDILSHLSTPPDVVIGGPPCQGFSVAGPTKDPNDPRNTLFADFANWVSLLQPKFFVMENVQGLLGRKNANGEVVSEIIKKTFEAAGYKVMIWNLNAANFGVPQLRNRIFFVGNLEGIDIPPPVPTHYIDLNDKKKYGNLKRAIKVKEALYDLPTIYAGQGEEIMEYTKRALNDYQVWARTNSSMVHNHVAMKHSSRMVKRYEEIINGKNFSDISEELKVRKRNGNGVLSDVVYQSNYRHLRPNSISYTIPASFYSNFIHPSLPRNITSREAARLQSFPDWYVFKGKRTQISSKLLKQLGKDSEDNLSQYNQIGNAVPPLLAKAIADHISNFL